MIRTCFAALLALCLTTAVSAADLITLSDGRTLEGEYIGGSRTSVSFRVDAHVERFALDGVRSLQFDPGRQPVAEAPSEAATNARIVATGSDGNALVIQSLPTPAGTAN